jgi:hypothetical protein
MDHPTSWNLF